MRYVSWLPFAPRWWERPRAGGLAEVTVVDCDTGATLTPHDFHGEYRSRARQERAMPSRFTTECGTVLAVTAVDGVNVISGEGAGWDQNGYVFSPGSTTRSPGGARVMTKSRHSRSRRCPILCGLDRTPRQRRGDRGGAVQRAAPAGRVNAARESRRQAASSGAAGAPRAAAAKPCAPAPLSAKASLKNQPDLGTGHGEREYSYVSRTDFDRLSSEPNEVIRIRYDSLQNLIAMGIVRRPRPAAPGADPFPASDRQYVPDPPG